MRGPALFILTLFSAAATACGGGGSASVGSVPPGNGAPGPTASPHATPSVGGTATPAPTAAPASDGSTMIADTTGRVGLFQEFDRGMTSSQIISDAHNYDAVWGANSPQLWHSVNPRLITSRYFIPQEDRSQLSGHDLTWWQTNHPDWILYACKADGTPTHDFAYWGGVDKPDVPLDQHNPAVIDYQVRQLNGMNAIANGDQALAVDQIVFKDAMVGGNPNFGQSVKTGEYACGIWQGTTFVRRYTGVNDPAWTADMVAFVKATRRIVTTDATLAPYHLKVIVNHPLGSMSDPNEQALLQYIDGMVDEAGYANYARYNTSADKSLFHFTATYLVALQKRNIAAFIINSFRDAAVTPIQREYAVATYFMSDQGGQDMYVSPGPGGSQENFPEYSVRLGKPCEGFHGGPFLYERRYSGGLVLVNSGSLPTAFVNASLPTNHAYTDIEGRKVTNPLPVASSDAYVLTTTNGCS